MTGRQFTSSIALDDPIESLVTEAADRERTGRFVGSNQQLSTRVGSLDDGRQRNRLLGRHVSLERLVPVGRVERLDEEVDRATAGETHGKGFVVAVPETDDAMGCGLDDVERLDHDGSFDTTAAHRPAYVLVDGDGHRGAGQARTRSVEVDHASDGCGCGRPEPPVERIEKLLHRSQPTPPLAEHPRPKDPGGPDRDSDGEAQPIECEP